MFSDLKEVVLDDSLKNFYFFDDVVKFSSNFGIISSDPIHPLSADPICHSLLPWPYNSVRGRGSSFDWPRTPGSVVTTFPKIFCKSFDFFQMLFLVVPQSLKQFFGQPFNVVSALHEGRKPRSSLLTWKIHVPWYVSIDTTISFCYLCSSSRQSLMRLNSRSSQINFWTIFEFFRYIIHRNWTPV